MDTAYHGGAHRRSHSETRAPTDGDTLISGREDVLMDPLDPNKSVEDLYDPHTRTGRPSFARSAHNSPMINPTIHVHEPEKLNLEHGGFAETPLPPRPRGPTRNQRLFASLRFVATLIIFLASMITVGVNAAVFITYNKHRDAEKLWSSFGEAPHLKILWPAEGVDTRPITAYIGIGAANALVSLVFLVLSFRKSFRNLDGMLTKIVILGFTAVFFVLWLLIIIFLQFQTVSGTKKHSFLTWSCTHTGSMYAVGSFSFSNLCSLSRVGRGAGVALVAANAILLIAVLIGCCSGRNGRGYAPVANPGRAWMPKWVKK